MHDRLGKQTPLARVIPIAKTVDARVEELSYEVVCMIYAAAGSLFGHTAMQWVQSTPPSAQP